jgi:hypothetical protein
VHDRVHSGSKSSGIECRGPGRGPRCGEEHRCCRLRRTGAISLAEAIASFLSESLVELDLERNDIQEGGGRARAETLRLNTTLTSLDLDTNDLGEGGRRALAKTCMRCARGCASWCVNVQM